MKHSGWEIYIGMKVDYKHTHKLYMKWFCGSNCEKDAGTDF